MMTKVYSYDGITSGVINIPAGRAVLRVEFSKGYLDKKLNRPAIYSTSDPTVMAIIEGSPLFGTKIHVHAVYGQPEIKATQHIAQDDPESTVAEDEPVSVEPAPVPESATEYPEVTNFEQAVKVLKSFPDVKASQLRSFVSLRKVASDHRVVFPNYNFD